MSEKAEEQQVRPVSSPPAAAASTPPEDPTVPVFVFFGRFWTSRMATGPPSPCRGAAAAPRASPPRAPWTPSSCPRPSPPVLLIRLFCRPQVLLVPSSRPVLLHPSPPVPWWKQVGPLSSAVWIHYLGFLKIQRVCVCLCRASRLRGAESVPAAPTVSAGAVAVSALLVLPSAQQNLLLPARASRRLRARTRVRGRAVSLL